MAEGLLDKANIILTPTGYKAGTMYNVAPIEQPYEDFVFSRASVASRVNSSGLVEMVGRTLSSELVTNGDFTDGLNNWFVNANATGYVSTSSDTLQYLVGHGDYAEVKQLNNSVIGKTYTGQFEVISKGTNADVFIQYGRTSIYTGSINSLDLGVHTFTVVSSHTDGFSISVRTNGIVEIDNVSVKEIIDTNNIPRISYDSNGDNGHILLEPTSTNLVPYSENFGQGYPYWKDEGGNQTIDPNVEVAPNNTLTADKLTVSSSANETTRKLWYPRSTTPNTKYTFSVYVKSVNNEVNTGFISIANLDVHINQTFFTATNVWQRVSVTATATANTSRFLITGDSNCQVYIWGAQIEALSYATSYIPTLTGSTETRATETATGAGSADLINSTEGVLYAEIAALANDGSVRYLSLTDGTSNNMVLVLYYSTANNIRTIVTSGGTNYMDKNYGVTSVLDFHKVAIRWKANDFSLWVNGSERKTDTSGSVPIGLNSLSFDSGTGSSNFYGKVKAVAVFNEALSDSELNNLTG